VKQKLVREQFADTMLEVGKIDPKLVVIVGDISHFNLQPFAQACPGRYYNIGICESAMMSISAGLSKVGFHVVAHTIAPFIVERAFEQLKLDFCYHQLGGNVITVGSAFDYSNLGCTHHCYDDFALFKTLQGTKIFYPATTVEFDQLFRQAYQGQSLNLYRLPVHQHGVSFTAEQIAVGKGLKIVDGTNLTIIATGPQLRTAMDARQGLLALGWNPEIIYLHTIRPLDAELVRASLNKTKRVIVIEEHIRSGGLGDDICRIAVNLPDVRYASLAIPDEFVRSYGSYQQHCQRLGLSVEGIIRAAQETFTK
jgi:transketolase